MCKGRFITRVFRVLLGNNKGNEGKDNRGKSLGLFYENRGVLVEREIKEYKGVKSGVFWIAQ
jgi:hypothetical protein